MASSSSPSTDTPVVKPTSVSEFDVTAYSEQQTEIINRLKQSILANDPEARKKVSKYDYDYWSLAIRKPNGYPYDYDPFIYKFSNGTGSVEIQWKGLVPPPIFVSWSGYYPQRGKQLVRGREVTIGPYGGWADYQLLDDSSNGSLWMHDFDPDAILKTYIESCDWDATIRIREAEEDIANDTDADHEPNGTSCSSDSTGTLKLDSDASSSDDMNNIEIQELVMPAEPVTCGPVTKEERFRELFPHEYNGSAEAFERKEKLKRQKLDRMRHYSREFSDEDSNDGRDDSCYRHKTPHKRVPSSESARSVNTVNHSSDPNAALKPRKGGKERSTRPGCVPRCISKESHGFEWEGKEEDIVVFNEFVQAHCREGSCVSAMGKDLQTSYKAYQKEHPDKRKLGNKQLGWCCEVQYCKTDSCNKVKYHGVTVVHL